MPTLLEESKKGLKMILMYETISRAIGKSNQAPTSWFRWKAKMNHRECFLFSTFSVSSRIRRNTINIIIQYLQESVCLCVKLWISFNIKFCTVVKNKVCPSVYWSIIILSHKFHYFCEIEREITKLNHLLLWKFRM